MKDFFDSQLAVWKDARDRYEDLKRVEQRSADVDGYKMVVQFNPARIISSGAKIDPKSLAARKCFLCDENRPPEQMKLEVCGYNLLVNPFPIAPMHFVLASPTHSPQKIDSIESMIALAEELEGMVLLYNGPLCGASAPDHFHYQAVEKEFLPIVGAVDRNNRLPFDTIVVSGDTLADKFHAAIARLPQADGEPEPKFNLLAWRDDENNVKIVIIPRRRHRPLLYGDSEGQILCSPATVDFGGVFVAPRRCDYDRLTPEFIHEIMSQVCYSPGEMSMK